MSYFADTNLAFGYTVIHDKWHENSKEFIEDNNLIFWSTLVQKEYTEKLDDVLDDIEYFLESIELILEDNEVDFVSFQNFERFILKKLSNVNLDGFKQHRILENFWNDNDFTFVGSHELYLKFLKFKSGFNYIYFKRDQKLNTILKLHDCGVDNYLNYLDFAKKVYGWGVHSPDCKIIADAHDCGITYDNLVFVSTDESMLEVLKNNDTSFLNIIEFKSIN